MPLKRVKVKSIPSLMKVFLKTGSMKFVPTSVLPLSSGYVREVPRAVTDIRDQAGFYKSSDISEH